MEKGAIAQKFFARLQNYISGEEFKSLQSDNPIVAAQIMELTPDKLIIGDCPKVFEAHFEGNVTGKGHNYSGDTRYERTFCTDFTTGYFLFIAEGGLSDKNLCNEALRLAKSEYSQVFNLSEKNTLVQNEIDILVKSELRKLDFWFDRARLNSWNLVHDSDETELPYYPVYANLNDGNGGVIKTVIGAYSDFDGNEVILCDLKTRIVSQPINARTSISAKAAAAASAKKRKIAVACGVIFTVLIVAGTALGSILPNIL